jgi:comEA protein
MLDLTSSEKRIIVIVSLVIIVAGIIQLLKPHLKKQTQIDYNEADSIFNRLSHTSSVPFEFKSQEKLGLYQNLPQEKPKQTSSKIGYSSIDINTAQLKDLEKLPRIGPAMAKRIILYRNEYGLFKSIDELQKVKGIGKKTLEKIKPYLKKIH